MPAYADERQDYLGPMLACGVLTLVLAVLLGAVTTLHGGGDVDEGDGRDG